MAPPSCYTDLTKPIRDFFTKHYPVGVGKIDFKRKTQDGMDFNAVTTVVSESGKSTGFVEAKYKFSDKGLLFKQKWLTENLLNSEFIWEDILVEGGKLISKLHYNPQTNNVTGTAGLALKRNGYHVTTELDYNNGKPQVNSSLVYNHRGFLFGTLVGFCAKEFVKTKTNLTVGYAGADMTMLFSSNDFKEYTATAMHQIRPEVMSAVSVNWNSGDRKPAELMIGAMWEASRDTIYRAKLSNIGKLSLAMTQKMKDGVELTLCACFDAKDFQHGCHKLGVGVNFEA